MLAFPLYIGSALYTSFSLVQQLPNCTLPPVLLEFVSPLPLFFYVQLVLLFSNPGLALYDLLIPVAIACPIARPVAHQLVFCW